MKARAIVHLEFVVLNGVGVVIVQLIVVTVVKQDLVIAAVVVIVEEEVMDNQVVRLAGDVLIIT